MNHGEQWCTDWRDDAPTADELRDAVFGDDSTPAARARMEFESTGMIVESDLPGGLFDPEDYRAWCQAHQPQEKQS